MKLYSGGEGSKRGLQKMRDLDMGRLVSASGWRRDARAPEGWRLQSEWKNPIDGVDYVLDSGVFSTWQRCIAQNRPVTSVDFPADLFVRTWQKIPSRHRPTFAVVPDLPAQGLDSLTFSLRWLNGDRYPTLPHGWPWYLAVQDGMKPEDVKPHVHRVAGLFVGGKLDWKHDTGEEWVRWGHDHGLPVHIGRVYRERDILWARRIGADSVDSTGWARNDRYGIVSGALKQRHLKVTA